MQAQAIAEGRRVVITMEEDELGEIVQYVDLGQLLNGIDEGGPTGICACGGQLEVVTATDVSMLPDWDQPVDPRDTPESYLAYQRSRLIDGLSPVAQTIVAELSTGRMARNMPGLDELFGRPAAATVAVNRAARYPVLAASVAA